MSLSHIVEEFNVIAEPEDQAAKFRSQVGLRLLHHSRSPKSPHNPGNPRNRLVLAFNRPEWCDPVLLSFSLRRNAVWLGWAGRQPTVPDAQTFRSLRKEAQ
jgi:hypothetical protein